MNFSYSPDGEGRVAMPADHNLQETETESSVALRSHLHPPSGRCGTLRQRG